MTPPVRDWLPILVRKTDKLLNPDGLSIQQLYTSAPSLGTKIPNVVYQTWKLPHVSAPHARAIKGFRNRNSDFTFEFFDDARATAYMEANYFGHPIMDVFRYVKVPAARADVWRYCVLLKEGGMYCDIDSLIRVPLRTFLKGNPTEVLSFEGGMWGDVLAPGEFADEKVFRSEPSPAVRAKLDFPDHPILNWFLAFTPGHPALSDTLDVIVENFPFFKDRVFDPVWRGVLHSTGPLALTQGVWRWLDRSPVRPVQRGIDFNGKGLFKIPGEGGREKVSPYYRDMKARSLGT